MVAKGESIRDFDFDMPCFYLRNSSFMAIFRLDNLSDDKDQAGKVEATLCPSLNLERKIKESKWKFNQSDFVFDHVENLKYEIDVIEDSDQIEEEQMKQARSNKARNEEGNEEEEDMDLQDLMGNLIEPINLTSGDTLKAQSMHHFKLNVRDKVRLYRFKGFQNIHAIFLLLLNHVAELQQTGLDQSRLSGVV